MSRAADLANRKGGQKAALSAKNAEHAADLAMGAQPCPYSRSAPSRPTTNTQLRHGPDNAQHLHSPPTLGAGKRHPRQTVACACRP